MKTEGTFAGNVGDAEGPRFAGAGSKDEFINVCDVGDGGPLVAETGALMLLIVAVLV